MGWRGGEVGNLITQDRAERTRAEVIRARCLEDLGRNASLLPWLQVDVHSRTVALETLARHVYLERCKSGAKARFSLAEILVTDGTAGGMAPTQFTRKHSSIELNSERTARAYTGHGRGRDAKGRRREAAPR